VRGGGDGRVPHQACRHAEAVRPLRNAGARRDPGAGESGGGYPEAAEAGAAAPEGPEEPPCLDPRYLRELSDLGGNSDFVVRLAWTFLKGSKEKVRGLERAVADRDLEKARELAHALKGNSGRSARSR